MNKTKEATKASRIIFYVLLITIPPLALFLILTHDFGLSERLDKLCTWVAGAFTAVLLCTFLQISPYMGPSSAAEQEVFTAQAQSEEKVMYIFDEEEVSDDVRDIAVYVPLTPN